MENSASYKKTSCFIQQVFNIHFILFLGKAAELDFHNLTNKYRRERRKIMTPESSGSGTKDISVQISDLYTYLIWLDQYIQPRDTLHNMNLAEPESDTYDDIDTYNFDDNASLASSFQQLEVIYRL